MIHIQNVKDSLLLYSGLLRDGGSAVIIIQLEDRKIKLRVMRSISEQAGDFFNKIEISFDDSTKWTVDFGSDIHGLNLFIDNNKERLDSRVADAFYSTLPSQGETPL